MTPRKNDMTMSDAYDKKLRSELYLRMLKLQDLALEMEYHEDHDDVVKISLSLLALRKQVPLALNAYFKCMEEGQCV